MFTLDGPAALILPGAGGLANVLPASGGRVEFGPLAGLTIPGATGYQIRNGGREPLVLLVTTSLASQEIEGHGYTLDPLYSTANAATPTP